MDKGWTRTQSQLALQHLHKSIYLKENKKINYIDRLPREIDRKHPTLVKTS